MTGTDWRSWVEDTRALEAGEAAYEELARARAKAARGKR
jgi:hypothetical protein